MEKKSKKGKIRKSSSVHYCTECGDKLDDFCFSDDLKDLDAIRENHENCKSTKKFKGDVCSRIFIATPLEIK